MSMSEIQTNAGGVPHDLNKDDSISIFDILLPLAKHKKTVFFLPLLFVLLGVVFALLQPNYYKASTKLLPPSQSQSSASAMLSQLGGLASVAGGSALGLKNPNDVYIAMLKSRTLLDAMVKRFDLVTIYELKSHERARKTLETSTVIASGKDGIITIEVEAKDKALATNLANAYVEELIHLSTNIAVTEASRRRLFFERQLGMAKDRLANAEFALKQALDQSGVVSVDGQSQAMLATLERLRATISAKEIQLQSMQAFVTASNPEYRRVQEELNSMRNQLFKMENGSSQLSTATNPKGAGLENIKAVRNVKYEQLLFEMLAKQYEAAKLDEAKDTTVIQILDRAVEPEFKSRPKRALIVLLSFIFGVISSLIYVFVVELMSRKKTDEEQAKWDLLKSYLKWNTASTKVAS
jgi:tyrosine-protein kinase Etk/Wzc